MTFLFWNTFYSCNISALDVIFPLSMLTIWIPLRNGMDRVDVFLMVVLL